MSTLPITKQIKNACSKIAPAWSLQNSIAVNPYLGLSNIPFPEAAEILKRRGNIQLYMPLSFYLDQFKKGNITKKDLSYALKRKHLNLTANELLDSAEELKDKNQKNKQVKTVSDLVKLNETTDGRNEMIKSLSEFLSNYFTQTANQNPKEMFSRWIAESVHDLSPEIAGIKGFRNHMKGISKDANEAIESAVKYLEVPEEVIESYLHIALLKLIGWSSYCAGLDFQNNVYGKESNYLEHLLAMIVTWEKTLLISHPEIKMEWLKSLTRIERTELVVSDDTYLETQAIFQDALDLSYQRKLINKFKSNQINPSRQPKQRAQAQMVFCIDVRSEVYRRNIEIINPSIETIGFAGFFGFPIKYKPTNHIDGRNQCPVLLPTGADVHEKSVKIKEDRKIERSFENKDRLSEAWAKFKSGSVSSFSFVSPLGIFYLLKLVTDSLGWTPPTNQPKKKEFGRILSKESTIDITAISLEEQVKMAGSALKTMGLTTHFAPLVLITGHGSTSINNPHASGLDCGACGGNSGEINALVAQQILNDPKVRLGLKKDQIIIPEDTAFVACLHDTTTDEISILNEADLSSFHLEKLNELKVSLKEASSLSRKVRSERFKINNQAIDSSIFKRANDWSQVRPEWGLAGCSSFVIAPREKTQHINLEGQSFLHSYSWSADSDFKVLEAIMTAPMVVTSWINLQYYASTVDNHKLGAGNKTLHNVIGGLGVIEGSSDDLRIGLPFQSIHDGKEFQHLPYRLNVIIDAPQKAVVNIIKKHNHLSELFDNQWISLMLLDKQGQIKYRYTGQNEWEDLTPLIETKNKEKLVTETI